MQAEANILSASVAMDRDFIGEGEIVVRREGCSRARHLFIKEGRVIGRLRWQGLRGAVYESDGVRLEIRVGALGRRINIIGHDGDESCLIERSRNNPHRREDLRIEAAEGDNFCISRTMDRRLRSQTSLTVYKEFYASTLMIFRYETMRRTQTTFHVEIKSTMKREARFGHRLLALLASHIILERRHSGSHPQRAKEKSSSVSHSRARIRFRH